MDKEEIRKLQLDYAGKGLLQHPDVMGDVQKALNRVPDELPRKILQRKLLDYRVLPLLAELEIYLHAVKYGTISKDQEQRLEALERFYQSLLKEKPYQQIMATDLENERRVVKRFDPHTQTPESLRRILIQNGACYVDTRRLDDIVEAFYHDSLLGGSVIITVESTGRSVIRDPTPQRLTQKDRRDHSILTVGKFFVCVDRDQNPVLAADHYSFGDYHSRNLNNWLEQGKIDLFAFGPTALLYLAEMLKIKRAVYCDLEMAEFAKQCGVPRKQVFRQLLSKQGPKYDDRKAGVVAVVDNSKGVWHHTHSIYHESSGRYFALDHEPVSMNEVFDLYERLRHSLVRDVRPVREGGMTPTKHDRFRIKEKFTAMYTILRVMEEMYLGTQQFAMAKRSYNEAIDLVRTRNPTFSLPYVK